MCDHCVTRVLFSYGLQLSRCSLVYSRGLFMLCGSGGAPYTVRSGGDAGITVSASEVCAGRGAHKTRAEAIARS